MSQDVPKSFLNEKPRQIGSCPKCNCEDTKVIKTSVDWLCFKCRHCSFIFAQKKTPPYNYLEVTRGGKKYSYDTQTAKSPTHAAKTRKVVNGHTIGTFLIIISLIIGVVFVVSLNKPLSNNSFSSSPSPLQSSSTSFELTTPPSTSVPPICPTLPPTPTPNAQQEQQDLVDYALSLINTDRQANGLQNVTLSNEDSGQQHADDMLKNGYFSHWDMNGYKPYMRYTLDGGEGAVAENIAWQPDYPYFGLKESIENMEWYMMYNDSSSNWGHKDNILNPLHNRISIGIAFNSTDVYFVEDFEDAYIYWTGLRTSQDSHIDLEGNMIAQDNSIQLISIYYDNPSPLTVDQLQKTPYQDGYDSGSYVGSVVPQGYESNQGITITADTWQQSGSSFDISFSLSQAIAVHQSGVYTLYIQTSSGDLTSYSVFV
ncbi:MAG: CAP domain-containing protein [Candidatus Bathyarchaeia archaeon]|jgi:uncharacterized protein YkwD